MSLLCKLFGHKYKREYILPSAYELVCTRCKKIKDVSEPQKIPPKRKSWKDKNEK